MGPDSDRRYGFLVVARKHRWRVEGPEGILSEWFDDSEEAENLRTEWAQNAFGKVDEALASQKEKTMAARDQFIANTEIRRIKIKSTNLLERGTHFACFPDGRKLQIGPDPSQKEIDAFVEKIAGDTFPEPQLETNALPPFVVNQDLVWQAELGLGGRGEDLPDIESWNHYFPIEAVVKTLNGLAGKGWSIAHVSEDRGLFSGGHATNTSVPITVRYLLVRTG